MTDWPVRRYESIDSTNEEAKRLARAGTRGPLWITAARQTAGRGRRGREWVSDEGNLFASLLMEAPANAAELCFAAGLAVAETAEAFAPSGKIALKWPNDVLLEGRKLAGILLEQEAGALAIGIGMNLAQHPENTEFPAISLKAASGIAPTPDMVLPRLASAMTAWYEVWRGRGFAPIRTAWLGRAAGLGEVIRARLPQSEVTGVFEYLDQDGALLLREAGGALQRITAADVFFPSMMK